MSAIVPNLDDLLAELPANSPAHDLVIAFADTATVEDARARLAKVVQEWLATAQEERHNAAPTASA